MSGLAWFQTPFAEAVGWTLVHSLWQLALLGAVAAMALLAMRRTSANARYVVAGVTLLTMLAAPVGTWIYLLPRAGTTLVMEAPDPKVVHLHAAMVLSAQSPVTTPDSVDNSAPMTEAWTTRALRNLRAVLPTVVGIYFGCLLFLLGRLATGYGRLRALRRVAQAGSPELRATMDSMCRRLGVRRHIELLESVHVEVPALLGAIRPIILFPACALSGLSTEQIAALIAHEVAHVRRHDFIANIVQSLIETVLFYHPAVWWLSRQVRQEREHCCDDLAMSAAGDRLSYAQALARMESLRPAPMRSSGLALAARGGALLPRIRRILGTPGPVNRGVPVTVALFLMACISALVYVGCNSAASPKPAAAETNPADAVVSVEARWLLVPNSVFDDFRIGYDLSLPASLDLNDASTSVMKAKVGLVKASIIDDWTLNLLLHAASADARTGSYTAPLRPLAAQQVTAIQGPLADARVKADVLKGTGGAQRTPIKLPASFLPSLNLSAEVSADRRYAILKISDLCAVGTAMKAEPDGALVIERSVATRSLRPDASTQLSVPGKGTLLIYFGDVVNDAEGHRAMLLVRPNILATGSAGREPPAAASLPAAPEGMIVRVYDLGDLVRREMRRQNRILTPISMEALQASVNPPAPDAPSSAPQPAALRQQALESVMHTLMTSVAPKSWQSAGGTGQLRQWNEQLVVTQTPAVQKELAMYLSRVREAAALQTAIEARLLLVDDATLKALSLPQGQVTKWSAGAGQPEKVLTLSTIDDAQVKAIIAKTEGAKGVSTLTAPRVTFYDGDDAWIAQQQMQNYVESFTPKPEAAWQGTLNIKTFISGTLLRVRNQVSEDRRSVALSISPSIRVLDQMETVLIDVPPGVKLPADGTRPFYQKPHSHGTGFGVDVVVPDQKTLVITGDVMDGNFPSVESGFMAGAAGWSATVPVPNAGRRNLVVMVRPQIIPHRNLEEVPVETFDDIMRKPAGLP